MADNQENFERFEPDYRDVRDLGDRVLAIGTIRVRGRGSGVETDIPAAGIATFNEDGRLVRWEDFRERHLALEAAGLAGGGGGAGEKRGRVLTSRCGQRPHKVPVDLGPVSPPPTH